MVECGGQVENVKDNGGVGKAVRVEFKSLSSGHCGILVRVGKIVVADGDVKLSEAR